jgi:hypothetical protein
MKYKTHFLKKFVIILPVIWAVIFTYGWIQNYGNKPDTLKTVTKQYNVKVKNDEGKSAPDTVKIGAYLFSIYDLDFPGNKVNMDFYVWLNTKKDSLNLAENFEVVNSIQFNKLSENNERRGDINYITFRVNSELKNQWDVSNFPFDKQRLEVIIEDADKDNSQLVFVADTIASKMDPNVKMEGWKISDFNIKTVDYTYQTNYGDPAIPLNEYSAYSRVILSFTIQRVGNGLFFKLFIGLFISVLISLLTFFIDPVDLDPRFGLSVGAIFAAIASQYVITSTLPQNARLTLVDILHDISFIFIFLCILGSVISLHLKKKNQIAKHKKLDKISFVILTICYLTLAFYFVIRAL